jgi:hypothetical protein
MRPKKSQFGGGFLVSPAAPENANLPSKSIIANANKLCENYHLRGPTPITN